MAEEKEGFIRSASNFFKRMRNQDMIRVGDNKITTLNQPENNEERKRRTEFSIFRQHFQSKNWSTRHMELFNEYRKMDDSFPIINAALRIYCLSGETRLLTPMGEKTILELFNDGKNKSSFYVNTVDLSNGRTQWGYTHYIKHNGVKPVYEVEVERVLDEETSKIDKKTVAKFKCTSNHKIMIADKSFKMLSELKVGDELFSYYKYIDPECKCKKDRFQNTKILSIKLVGEEDVYDLINVEPFSHFSILVSDTMFVQVHNCQEVCFSLDTKVTLLDDSVKTLKELIDSNAKDFWVWSYDNENKKIVPAKCEKVISKGFKEVVKITLDDGTVLKCTPEHKQLLKNGDWIETKNLKVGDSLRSIYERKGIKGQYQLSDGDTCLDGFEIINYLKPKDAIDFNIWHYENTKAGKVNVDKLEAVNHKIVSIEFENEIIEVGDIVNAGEHHNWAVTCNDGMMITHNCTQNEDGNIIQIHSSDKEIKKSLEDLFFRTLKLNSQGNLLVKEMLKFGNIYCFLNARKGDGVIDIISLPPESIRIELMPNAEHLDDFKYSWFGASGGGTKFEPWEVVHFRNIEDLEMQPYGTSILRSIVDTWRRIILMREALIIYRITRAPQRYLFKIDTTGMDPDAALLYSDEVKKQLYKKPLINPFTGELDFKYNPLPISGKTPIPLLCGEIKTIKELADDYDKGIINYVYSIKDTTHEIVAGKVKWCGKNYTANKLIRVWLDNDSYIDSAPEHPFMLRDGSRRNAEDLKAGDSLMPGYVSEKKVDSEANSTYTTVYNPATEKYEFVHRLIAKEIKKEKKEYNTIHHIDFNRYNNLPSNLQWMDFWEHANYHISLNKERWANDALYRAKMIKCNIDRESWKKPFEVLNSNPELREKQKIAARDAAKKDWKNHREAKVKGMTLLFNDEIIEGLKNSIIQTMVRTNAEAIKFINEVYKEVLWKINSTFSKQPKVTKTILKIRFKELGYNGFEDFRGNVLNISKSKARGIATSLGRRLNDSSESYSGEKNPNYKGWFLIAEAIELLNAKIIIEDKFSNFNELKKYLNVQFPNNKQKFYLKELCEKINLSPEEFTKKYLKSNFKKLRTKESFYLNHKVAKIEILENVSEDVYCMTVIGLNNEEDRHNFMVGGHTINNDVIGHNSFIFNSIEENLYMPTYEGDVGGVEVLQGATNLNDVEDYKIIKDDLFAGLLIPKSYLSFEEDLCLKGSTEVLTNTGKITIKELSDNWVEDKKLFVLSCNKYGYITPGKVLWVKETKQVNSLYQIVINNSFSEYVTPNHPFLMDDLSYVNAEDLKLGFKLKGIYEKDFYVTDINVIEYLDPESVYDLEVEEHHNFALASGIFVHNSNKAALAQEDIRFAGAVKQYQGNFVEGLLHIAIVHLSLQGFSKEDLENFEIQMNTNSKLLKKLENETLQQQVDLAKSILDISNGELTLMSFTQVLKDIMHFSDEQIKLSFENQLIEKSIAWKLDQLKTSGFYVEPEESKKQELAKRLGDEDIFSKLKFESLMKTSTAQKILTEGLKKELAGLIKPVKLAPTKLQINKLIDLNPIGTEIDKIKRDLKLRG